MRAIKIRAWDGEKFGYVTLHPGGSVHVPTADHFKRGSYSADHISFQNLKPWEQYTGLKDKNGVEIYEGDIMEYALSESMVGVVVYAQGGYHLKNKRGKHFPLITYLDKAVIGNIHENPELLEVTDERS